MLALAQIRAKSLFAGMGRVKAGVPLERAEVLSAPGARITGIRSGRAWGPSVDIISLDVAWISLDVAWPRAIGLIDYDRPQDAETEAHAQATAEAVVVAELNRINGGPRRRGSGAAGGRGCRSRKRQKGERRRKGV
jgi:hypothetical protein